MENSQITQLYEAFNAHDLKAAVALLHPDVVWPSGAEGDFIEGREAVGEYWERQWKLTDAHMEPQQSTTDDTGRLVVDVHQVVHDLSGHPLWDDTVQHIYQIENDLIRSMEIKNEQPKPVDDTYSPL